MEIKCHGVFEPNHSVLNKFHQIKTKTNLLGLDIKFLTTCKKQHLIPNFIQIKANSRNHTALKAIQLAERSWLSAEIRRLHAKRSNLELEAYKLYKDLSSTLFPAIWDEFHRKVNVSIAEKREKKKKSIDKKLKSLLNKREGANPAQRRPDEPNFIINLSKATFDQQETNLLNKGLKFALQPKYPPIEEIIADIEVAIRPLNENDKKEIRNQCSRQITKFKKDHKNTPPNRNTFEQTIKTLKSKEVIYTKSDKGNTLVIMDKKEYSDKVTQLLEEGNYTQLPKNPLPKMIRDTNKTISECTKVLPTDQRYLVKAPNPEIPKLYCLPKIHKPGYPLRPIVSNINAPTYNLSKKLVQDFQTFEQPTTLSVKNNLDLLDKLKDLKIDQNDRLISFDVKNLFPSIPIPETLTLLKTWLEEKNMLDKTQAKEYHNLVNLCMTQNIFQVNGLWYKQTEGTSMGNPLSPFLAELFMSNFEITLKNNNHLPKIWYRYVDDIFCIIPESFDINQFLNTLNNQYPSISFTFELEQNAQLPFLDILIKRKTNHLEFEVYRKPTSTPNYIPKDSYQPTSQKLSFINSMIHRALHFPLQEKALKKELKTITDIAKINGFSPETVEKQAQKQRKKMRLAQITTLKREEQCNRRVKLTFYPILTNKLSKILTKHKITPAYSNPKKLKVMLGNSKDKEPPENNSGIYKVSCQNCDGCYIGQTKRNIKTRLKEHLYAANRNLKEKSAIAEHIINTGHKMDNLDLLRKISSQRELPIFESIYMHKNKKNLINTDLSPLENPLLNCIPIGYSTRPTTTNQNTP